MKKLFLLISIIIISHSVWSQKQYTISNKNVKAWSQLNEGAVNCYSKITNNTSNFNDTVFESLMAVMDTKDEDKMRSVAAGFMLSGEIVRTKIGSLSEGQKGLVAFAQLVLLRPGLLILDEPTNHINFRHIPIIAQALDKYLGAMIIVSHVPEFIEQIRIDETLDLEK